MLSKSKIKYIHLLEQKKFRLREDAFVAEGRKLVGDLMGYFPCRLLIATREWMERHPFTKADECVETSAEELARASLQKSPGDVLAVFQLPHDHWEANSPARDLCLALDDVQDPGNLGTILRLADWFGIRHVCCSPGTADAFSPKAVQATMGALARVKVHYGPLEPLVRQQRENEHPVYGTFLDGQSIYTESLTAHGLIVMGNEGRGISSRIEALVNHRLFIPPYPQGVETSESLNVAMATAIVCAEFRRRTIS